MEHRSRADLPRQAKRNSNGPSGLCSNHNYGPSGRRAHSTLDDRIADLIKEKREQTTQTLKSLSINDIRSEYISLPFPREGVLRIKLGSRLSLGLWSEK